MRLDTLPPKYQRQIEAQLADEPATVAVTHTPSKFDIKAESDLQSLCENELNRRRIACLHLSFRAREKKGWPDLTFALSGRPIAVELKSASGKLSPEQVTMLTMMQENGWEVYVMRRAEVFIDLLNGHRPEMWETSKQETGE